jgi:SWI/SNF-related matrix-associated actin-dependent regulator 1 of chromatin subfamily A
MAKVLSRGENAPHNQLPGTYPIHENTTRLGVTLTAVSHVVFVEPDWTPALLDQAEARAHRIGQDSRVLVQYLVLENSLDEKILAAVQSKRAVINAIVER